MPIDAFTNGLKIDHRLIYKDGDFHAIPTAHTKREKQAGALTSLDEINEKIAGLSHDTFKKGDWEKLQTFFEKRSETLQKRVTGFCGFFNWLFGRTAKILKSIAKIEKIRGTIDILKVYKPVELPPPPKKVETASKKIGPDEEVDPEALKPKKGKAKAAAKPGAKQAPKKLDPIRLILNQGNHEGKPENPVEEDAPPPPQDDVPVAHGGPPPPPPPPLPDEGPKKTKIHQELLADEPEFSFENDCPNKPEISDEDDLGKPKTIPEQRAGKYAEEIEDYLYGTPIPGSPKNERKSNGLRHCIEQVQSALDGRTGTVSELNEKKARLKVIPERIQEIHAEIQALEKANTEEELFHLQYFENKKEPVLFPLFPKELAERLPPKEKAKVCKKCDIPSFEMATIDYILTVKAKKLEELEEEKNKVAKEIEELSKTAHEYICGHPYEGYGSSDTKPSLQTLFEKKQRVFGIWEERIRYLREPRAIPAKKTETTLPEKKERKKTVADQFIASTASGLICLSPMIQEKRRKDPRHFAADLKLPK